ncbi:MAG: dehydrogenase, partial [Marivirga sp.]|nr:dehydrogenase [Marivirga sp.]
ETYLRRNPELIISNTTESLSDHGEAAEVFPITLNPEHQLLTDVGVITSACGLTAYLGGAFPPPYDNATFVAEPVSNLVHVDRIKQKGTTFTASRIQEHKEFLASTDAKFRPVNMYVGPDGALYVIDYYRQIIEHPEWMSEDVVKSGALYNDTDKGRIYRITSERSGTADWIKGLTLGDATNEQLVQMLSNPNVWWRLNAQRLLVDRAPTDAAPALTQMTVNASPMGRLHALWTLEGIEQLRYEHLENALLDPEPGVRENAIKLAELHLPDMPQVARLLFALENDPDPKVRFQLLCTLGFLNSPEAIKQRQSLLFKDIGDNWVQIAALSAAPSDNDDLFKMVMQNYHVNVAAYSTLTRRLSTMAGSKGDQHFIHVLIQKAALADPLVQPQWHTAVLDGLADGIGNSSAISIKETHQKLLLKSFFEHPSAILRKATLRVLKVSGLKNEVVLKNALSKAVSIASDSNQADDKRADAIDFLSIRNPSGYFTFLQGLFVPTEQLSVQLASLRAMSAIPDTTLSLYLAKQWPVFTPEIREAAIRTFLTNDERVEILLRAIDSGKIKTTDLSWPQKVRLMAQSNDKLRDRARMLFTQNNDSEVNASYQKALEIKGDAIEGMNIYQAQCGLCHQVRGKMGISLGPDLGTIHNWSKEAILANVLAPNQSIASGYDLWAVELKNGESIQGIIASETPGAITLKNSGAVERTIRRQDINS